MENGNTDRFGAKNHKHGYKWKQESREFMIMAVSHMQVGAFRVTGSGTT